MPLGSTKNHNLSLLFGQPTLQFYLPEAILSQSSVNGQTRHENFRPRLHVGTLGFRGFSPSDSWGRNHGRREAGGESPLEPRPVEQVTDEICLPDRKKSTSPGLSDTVFVEC